MTIFKKIWQKIRLLALSANAVSLIRKVNKHAEDADPTEFRKYIGLCCLTEFVMIGEMLRYHNIGKGRE